MADYLNQICQFIVETNFEDFDSGVLEQAKKVLYDTLGVITAGAQQKEVQEMSKRLASLSTGHLSSKLIGQRKRIDPLNAALINGTAGTWLELDEGNQFARGHPGIHVIPAAIALGEEKQVSGKELLTALILGYDVGSRIGMASKLRMTMHPHGSWGTLGGTVAVGKLMKLNPDQMRTLINIASSTTLATSRNTMLQGGTVRNLYAGVSGYMAILSYYLLESGFTGEADGITAVYGGVVSDSFSPQVMVEELGSRYEITRNYFKQYACCRYNHSSLDAIYEIMSKQEDGKLDPENIENIKVETYSLAAQLCGKEPGNMLAAKFSLPFSIATTIVNGNSGVGSFLPEKIGQDEIRALASRVDVIELPEFTQMMPSKRPSRVTIRLKDGETFAETVFVSRGDIENPYSTEEIKTKFLDLTEPIYGIEKAKEILDKTRRIETFNNITDYTDGL